MALTGQQKRDYQLRWIRERRQAWIDSQGGVCNLCGSDDRLEVDHIDPALKSMQPASIWSRSEAVREVELAKCQVLCYDCHKVKTKLQREVSLSHGTATGYSKGCRCQKCRDIKAEGMRKSRNNRRSGSGNSGVATVS